MISSTCVSKYIYLENCSTFKSNYNKEISYFSNLQNTFTAGVLNEGLMEGELCLCSV